MYESVNEGKFKTDNVNSYEIQSLKDYMDAENISYSEDIESGELDFDETELDAEWQDNLNNMGFEEEFSNENPEDILTIDNDEDEENDYMSRFDDDDYLDE
jgi:hypothetical protein